MSTSPPADRCPGVVRLFPADDGGIARLRFPGGRLQPQDWTVLAGLAEAHGGSIHLTSRGNLQLRGVNDRTNFLEQIRSAGLLPSESHDRIRNVLASPLAGKVPGSYALGDLPEQLDAELLARDDVTALSGRFMFGFDDGSGDVIAHRPDLAIVQTEGASRLLISGVDSELTVQESKIPRVLADLAAYFASISEGVWRIPDVGPLYSRVLAVAQGHSATIPADSPTCGAARSRELPTIGWVDTVDGLVSLLAVVPFGVVPARLAEFIGAIERPSTVSADRVIGLHGLSVSMAEQVVRVLAPMGLIFDQSSRWVEVTACTGLPGCAKSLADVRADATAAVEAGRLPATGPQHWVGCDRGCGYPGYGTKVLATGAGYELYDSNGVRHLQNHF